MQFLNCKIRYLSSEISWISKQCIQMDQLNYSIKQILQQPQLNLTLTQQFCKKIKKIISYQNNNLQMLNLSQIANSQKSEEFYNLCVLLFANFDIRLQYMTDLVIGRQKKLQKIECQNKKLSQRTISMQQINIELMDKQIQLLIKGYSPYPYIIEHYQGKHKKLKLKYSQHLPNRFTKNPFNNNQKNYIPKKFDHPDLHTTIFEKTTLCLKKKQYTNSIKKNRNIQLKNKISYLQKVCSRVQNSLNNQNYNNNKQKNFTKFQLSNISKIDVKTILKEQEQKLIEFLNGKDISLLEGIGNLQFLGNKRFIQENVDQLPLLFQ